MLQLLVAGRKFRFSHDVGFAELPGGNSCSRRDSIAFNVSLRLIPPSPMIAGSTFRSRR